jgi:hypothetical protein
MSQSEPAKSGWGGFGLVTAGVVLLLLPVVTIFVGMPHHEADNVPIGGEPLFTPVEALFASVLVGVVLLLAGIPEVRKTPPRFRLRALLIAMTVVAVVLGFVAWAIRG